MLFVLNFMNITNHQSLLNDDHPLFILKVLANMKKNIVDIPENVVGSWGKSLPCES